MGTCGVAWVCLTDHVVVSVSVQLEVELLRELSLSWQVCMSSTGAGSQTLGAHVETDARAACRRGMRDRTRAERDARPGTPLGLAARPKPARMGY